MKNCSNTSSCKQSKSEGGSGLEIRLQVCNELHIIDQLTAGHCTFVKSLLRMIAPRAGFLYLCDFHCAISLSRSLATESRTRKGQWWKTGSGEGNTVTWERFVFWVRRKRRKTMEREREKEKHRWVWGGQGPLNIHWAPTSGDILNKAHYVCCSTSPV